MRRLSQFLGLAVAVLLLISAAAADDKRPDPQGKPESFEAGRPASFAVWHDKHGWHLRTTTAKKLHHFTGYVKVDGGTFTKIHSHHLEKEGRVEDHWSVHKERHEVAFNFKTDKGIDGIDFHLSKGAKHLTFNLEIDGKHHAKKILVGHKGHHPEHDPFRLPAHPAK